MDQITLAFDLYGTLLSTESIAEQLSTYVGEDKASEVAALWRRYQLEYTWRSNSMQIHVPFSDVTHRALVHALTESSLDLDQAKTSSLLQAYDSLSTFPDVSPALSKIAKDASIQPVVFSNGTNSMVHNSIANAPDLDRAPSVFRDVITVEEVKRYKPDPEVYHFLARKLGYGTERGEMARIWLISANPFDIVGAKSTGMKACWVDRKALGWTDQLIEGDAGKPDVVVNSLEHVVEAVLG